MRNLVFIVFFCQLEKKHRLIADLERRPFRHGNSLSPKGLLTAGVAPTVGRASETLIDCIN